MRLPSLLAATALVAVLAGCGGSNPPAEPASSSAPATSSEAAAPDASASAQTTEVAAQPAGDDKIAPMFGVWGLDPSQCTQTLTITKTRFEGPDSGCDISGWSDNGDGTYTAKMSCSASGQSSSEDVKMRPIFAPSGEGIDLTYVARNNLQSTVLRCGPPPSAEASN